MQWKTGRITLFDNTEKPVAEVARIATGWCWYVAGKDMGGDVATVTEAMELVEKAVGISTPVAKAETVATLPA